MKKNEWIYFILPLLLLCQFIVVVAWLNFGSSVVYLILFVACLAAAVLSKLFQKKWLILVGHIAAFVPIAFYAYAYLMFGPAGNSGVLLYLIISHAVLILAVAASAVAQWLLQNKTIPKKVEAL